MLIHECGGCLKLSINRIAADDYNDEIIRVFNDSLVMTKPQRDAVECAGIDMLDARDYEELHAQLFGR
jgi:hypothetical protein